MIGKAIYGILNSTASITDVVTGIFPVTAGQDTVFPYIVYQRVTTQPTDIKDGGSPLDSARFQVDVYASSKSTCEAIAANVRTALDRYNGTIESVVIQSIKFLDHQDGPYEEELRVFRVIQEYEIREQR